MAVTIDVLVGFVKLSYAKFLSSGCKKLVGL
jgi:hypothetical protein